MTYWIKLFTVARVGPNLCLPSLAEMMGVANSSCPSRWSLVLCGEGMTLLGPQSMPRSPSCTESIASATSQGNSAYSSQHPPGQGLLIRRLHLLHLQQTRAGMY